MYSCNAEMQLLFVYPNVLSWHIKEFILEARLIQKSKPKCGLGKVDVNLIAHYLTFMTWFSCQSRPVQVGSGMPLVLTHLSILDMLPSCRQSARRSRGVTHFHLANSVSHRKLSSWKCEGNGFWFGLFVAVVNDQHRSVDLAPIMSIDNPGENAVWASHWIPMNRISQQNYRPMRGNHCRLT